MFSAKKQGSQASAIKGSRRHAEFSKFLLAGFSGILFFVIDKEDCTLYRLLESIMCVIGILFSSLAILGYSRTADKLEEKKEILEGNGGDISKWLAKEIPNNIINIIHFRISSICIVICTIIFLLNPYFCKKAPKDEPLSIIKSYSFQGLHGATVKAPMAHSCRPSCKQTIAKGTCPCKQ